MKREIDTFLCAVMMLTRIRVPARIHHEHQLNKRSPKYYSWVGIFIGAFAGVVYLLAGNIFPGNISIFLSMQASILLTGAFHEDGFADVCDGFGGGWTKEKILLIMKDSRLGTYGVMGLVGILTFKFFLIVELSGHNSPFFICLIMIVGHAISRFAALTIMQQYNYVSGEESKSVHVTLRKLSLNEIGIATAGAVIPLIFLPPAYWLSLLLVVVIRISAGIYFNRWIRGYTGDCLGATQQLSEIAFYSGVYLVWKLT